MTSYFFPTGLLVLLIGIAMFAYREYPRAVKAHKDDASRLLALEDYRSKFKSLPDNITMRKIVESKPEDLEKLLRESQPSK